MYIGIVYSGSPRIDFDAVNVSPSWANALNKQAEIENSDAFYDRWHQRVTGVPY